MNTMLNLLAILALPCVCAITITIDPRDKFCFNEDVKKLPGQSQDLGAVGFYFKVLRGGKYKEISATVLSEDLQGKRRTVVSAKKVNSGNHRITLYPGNYSICFDNTFSVVTTKVVEFNWVMPSQEKPKDKVPTAKTAIDAITAGMLKKVTNMTETMRESRYQMISSSDHAETLNSQVNALSIAAIIAILIVSVIETTSLKRMFVKPTSRC